jgi:hypothetical protein
MGRDYPKETTVTLNAVPTPIDRAAESLHDAGWSIGEAATADGWIVTGRRGGDEIHATGQTQSEGGRQL